MRIPSTKLLGILRGNNPLLLDKVIYTEHPLYKKLNDNSVTEYNPKWTKNLPEKVHINDKQEKAEKKSEKKPRIDWETF